MLIKKVELLEYPELGMEAVWRIEVENFPAFIITDDKALLHNWGSLFHEIFSNGT